jgi:hypothetical protein
MSATITATVRIGHSISRPIIPDEASSWMSLALDLPADTPDWAIEEQIRLAAHQSSIARTAMITSVEIIDLTL